MTSKLSLLLIWVCITTYQLSLAQTTTGNAYYHFNNADANDYIGNFNAVSTTDVTYRAGAKNYAELKDSTGLIILPAPTF